MNVRNLILFNYPTVNFRCKIDDFREKLLEKGYVVVLDDKEVFVGILSLSDVVRNPKKDLMYCFLVHDKNYNQLLINHIC